MRIVIIILVLTGTFLSCKKEKELVSSKDMVEVYLLKSVQLVSGKCEVEKGETESTPLIANEDILGYSPGEHRFRIKDTAAGKVKALNDGTPFAVSVNGRVIYYGFFKPGYSSSSCFHSITMELPFEGKVFLRLGYPGTIEGVTVADLRNHPELISALSAQGKLD